MEDKIPIVWRIAFQLLADPVMDYQRTAERLWGLNLNKGVAKNRVNAHITQLRKMGVVTSLGNNRFAVNKELLAKHSKLPMTTEAAP